MEEGSTTHQKAPDTDDAERHPSGDELFVFGAEKALGPEELETLRGALLGLGPRVSTTWASLVLREIDAVLVDIATGPRSVDPDGSEPVVGATVNPDASWLSGLGGEDPFVTIAELPSGLGPASLVIPGELALLLVDLLLGGSGRSTGARSISAIDIDLLTSLVVPTLEGLHDSLVDVAAPRPPRVLEDLEDGAIPAMFGDSVAATFEVAVDDTSLQFFVILSESAVASILRSGGGDTPGGSEIGDAQRVIHSVLAEVVVEAVVNFPLVTVPSRTVLGIDIGDVIGLGLSTDSLLTFKVDDLDFGTVRPARSGSALACQVVTTATRVGPGSSSAPTRPPGPTDPALSSVPGGVL